MALGAHAVVTSQSDELKRHLVDLLIDDREPFALLLADLRKLGYPQDLSASSVVSELDELEQAGQVEAMYWSGNASGLVRPDAAVAKREKTRFPDLRSAALAADPHIGLWYSLTDEGRRVALALLGEPEEEDRWRIIELPIEGVLEVWAASGELAERAVRTWQEGNPELRLLQGPDRTTDATFALGDGTTVTGGVVDRYRFRSKP